MENNAESIFGVDIFTWKEWDDIDGDLFHFYNVSFCLESMKQYNGLDVSLNRSGYLEVYSSDNEEVVWKGYANSISDFGSCEECKELEKRVEELKYIIDCENIDMRGYKF